MLIRLSCLVLLATIAASAAGREPKTRWHAVIEGAGVSTKAPANEAQSNAELAAEGFTVIGSRESRGESSFALGVGFRVDARLDLEAGWIDTGQMHYYSGTFTQGANSGNRVKEWEASGFWLAGLVREPLGRGFSIIGRGRLYVLDGEFRTATLVTGPGGVIVSRTETKADGSGTAAAVAGGIAYAPAPELEVRALYERWLGKADVFGAGNELKSVQLLSIGVAYRF